MTEAQYMRQTAPWPVELEKLVSHIQYKPNWRFWLRDQSRDDSDPRVGGLTLTIRSENPDSYEPGRLARVRHLFIVPAATYNQRSWARWLFDRILDVEAHEAAEFARFTVIDENDVVVTTRPWAPNHSPGNDPYIIYTLGTDEQQRTLQDGTVLGKPRKNALDIIAALED